MKKYEYKTVMSTSRGLILNPDRELNKLGRNGWEAVGISHKDGLLITLFKREVE